MGVKYSNNASTTLSAAISSSATSISVASASEFPALSSNDHTYATIAAAGGAAIEIVKVTAISGTTLTVVRGQDNTSAQAFSSGDLLELRLTAVLLTDAINSSYVNGTSKRQTFTATSGQTSFTVTDGYDTGFIDVYLDGVKLNSADFTDTSGTVIVLASGAATGQIVDIIGYGLFTLSTHYSKTASDARYLAKAGGAMTGPITTNSTFDGVDIATRDAVLTSTTTTANAALPKAGGAMTGPITTNSTFDGVDIATRDGVLTSTTTTANNALPKAGGAMTGPITTNSTFDGVDVATRDGVLTSTTTTANAALPKAGGAMTGSTTHADNIKSKWGTSDDLEIYHDGSHSYVSDLGTGDLRLQGANVSLRAANGDNFIYCTQDGAVSLWHDGASPAKLTTASSGVTVTGTCTATAFSGDGSGLTGVDPFPSGTVMIFQQTSAPTGWTKSTSHNDKALRVVSGSVGSGGTHGLSSPPSIAHTHTGPSHTHTSAGHTHSGPSHTHSTPSHSHSHSLSAGAHTLSTSEMPSHNHLWSYGGYGSYNKAPTGGLVGNTPPAYTDNTGGGGSHSHSLSGSITSGGSGTSGSASGTTGSTTPGATGASGTGATGSTTPTAFAPQYIDVIVATKD